MQTHVHLCQTLFRSYADDMPLLDWLRRRVWPMEAAHTPATLRAATRLAAAELLLSGTTTALTMETVHDTDVVFETLAAIRAARDRRQVHDGFRAEATTCRRGCGSETQQSIDESVALRTRWDGAANGRLRAAFAPRFAVSCSRELLEAVAALSAQDGVLVHTHASESRDEIESCGSCPAGSRTSSISPRPASRAIGLCAAHCVWVSDAEQALMAERDVKVMHCPGSNLKLGSGIAPVVEMRARGICVSLGADGAACNNHLDMFDEMRLAATLQAVRLGPGALTAREALWMATREGARALGQDDEIGSIEAGKRADLILVNRDGIARRPRRGPLVHARLRGPRHRRHA